ncbi:MAG TPA: DUF559 domain-containing protein [Candidatus Dormibacteraeota bacterium]
MLRRGLRATSAIRTVTDLARRPPLLEAVIVINMATHRRLVDQRDLLTWAAAHPHRRGVRILRQAIDLSEPGTESPMETRLRLLLVFAGLPRPKVQVALYDESGSFVARPDLYYPGKRLAIEYDGATHRQSLAGDNRRQNRLIDAGFSVLRFTAADLLKTPIALVALVRRALAS